MRVTTVGDVSEQVRGVSYAKSEASDVLQPGYSPILRANNICENGLLLDDLVFVPDAKISQKQRIAPNDVIVAASSGSLSVVGKTAQAREGFEGGFGAFCKVLRPRPAVDPHYFGHYFRTSLYRHVISRLAAGANINNLRNEHLDNLSIPLPPLARQKRIAGILDAADALRAKRREALAQLDTLPQSTFLDMFGDPVTNPMGWEVQRLADVFWLQEGPGVRNWQFKESGIKLLNVSNILKSGELDLSKTDRHLSTDEAQEKYSHFLVDAGDLVIASSGIPIDEDDLLRTRSAFVRDEHLPLCMNTSTVRFKATDGISDLRFLQQWLQSHEFRRQITREVTGSAQKNFGPTHLKRLRITLPPLNLQHRFATIVESVEQQKASQRTHLTELDTLFASLQSRAFRGDI